MLAGKSVLTLSPLGISNSALWQTKYTLSLGGARVLGTILRARKPGSCHQGRPILKLPELQF